MAFWNKKGKEEKKTKRADSAETFTEREMKKRVNEIKLSKVISSLIFIVLGIVLIIWSEQALSVICTLIGAILCAAGVVAVVMYFVTKERGFMGTAMLSIGVIVAVIGLFLALNPSVLETIVPAIIGILILISGIINLSETITIHKENGDNQLLALILSLITIVLGVLIIINPSALNKVILVLMGISLIYDGVSNLIIIAGVTGMVKAVRQEVTAVDTTAKEVADAEEHTYTEVKRPSAQNPEDHGAAEETSDTAAGTGATEQTQDTTEE